MLNLKIKNTCNKFDIQAYHVIESFVCSSINNDVIYLL